MNNRIEDSKDKINKIKEKLTDSMIKNSKEDINNEELWLIDQEKYYHYIFIIIII